MRSDERVRYISFAAALVWLTFDAYLVISNITLRATPLHVVADYLDKLPSKISTPIFLVLWAIVLLGWIIPLGWGLRSFVRRK
jgi:hypothetical protein